MGCQAMKTIFLHKLQQGTIAGSSSRPKFDTKDEEHPDQSLCECTLVGFCGIGVCG